MSVRGELRRIVWDLLSRADVEWEVHPRRLLEESFKYGVKTRTGQLAVFTRKAKARVPQRTLVLDEPGVEERAEAVLERATEYIEKQNYVAIQRCIGPTGGVNYKILSVVEASYPHLSLMVYRNYFPCEEGGEPDIVTLDVPGFDDTWILVDRDSGTNLILASDYYGELKMSFLRLAMNFSRDKYYYLGLHAGSKLYTVRRGGRLEQVGVLIFGLSGTGKTTLTLEQHGLERPEKVSLLQDDIVILDHDGRAHGTEFNLYPKTDSVPELPPLQPAVLHPDAILENVVIKDGMPDFSDLSISKNARAVAIRDAIPNASSRVTLDRVNILVFLTRRPEMPALARLTSPEQAAAYFMLGESWRTSAEAGKPEPVRVPGFDPFMLPPKERSGMLMLDFVKRFNLEVYVMNTGWVKNIKVKPEESKHLLLALVKGEVEWRRDPDLGVDVAVKAMGRDFSRLDPRNVYTPSEYEEALRKLREERVRFFEEKLPALKWLADYV